MYWTDPRYEFPDFHGTCASSCLPSYSRSADAMPPPPPPLLLPAQSQSKRSEGGGDRSFFLSSIQQGTMLKKAGTNDRSAPVVGKSSDGAGGGGGGGGEMDRCGGSPMCGLFPGGVPRLPSHNSLAGPKGITWNRPSGSHLRLPITTKVGVPPPLPPTGSKPYMPTVAKLRSPHVSPGATAQPPLTGRLPVPADSPHQPPAHSTMRPTHLSGNGTAGVANTNWRAHANSPALPNPETRGARPPTAPLNAFQGKLPVGDGVGAPRVRGLPLLPSVGNRQCSNDSSHSFSYRSVISVVSQPPMARRPLPLPPGCPPHVAPHLTASASCENFNRPPPLPPDRSPSTTGAVPNRNKLPDGPFLAKRDVILGSTVACSDRIINGQGSHPPSLPARPSMGNGGQNRRSSKLPPPPPLLPHAACASDDDVFEHRFAFHDASEFPAPMGFSVPNKSYPSANTKSKEKKAKNHNRRAPPPPPPNT